MVFLASGLFRSFAFPLAVGRHFTREDAADIAAGETIGVGEFGAVADQAAGHDEIAAGSDGRYAVFDRQNPRTDRSLRAVARIADAGNIYLAMMDRKRPKRLRRPQRFSDC